MSDPTKPDALDPYFQELATRESGKLLAGVLAEWDQKILTDLRNCTSDRDLLYCQAEANVVEGIRKRLQRYRPEIAKDIPIIANRQRRI